MLSKHSGLTSASFEEITSGSDYRYMFSNLSVPVAKDETKTLVVKISVPSVQESSTDSVITFKANAVRGTDGLGLTQQAPTADLAATRTIDFTDKAAGELEVTANTANVERTAALSTSETTQDVELGKIDFKAKSNDVTLKTLKVTVTSTDKDAGALDESLVMPTIKLYDGATLLSSQSVAAGGAVVFDSLTVAIAKDSTKTLTLKGDFLKVRGEGDITIVALTGITQTDIVAEDANYDNLVCTGDCTGAAGDKITATTAIAKKVHTFSKSPTLTFVNSSISLKSDSAMKQADATITFKVKANGGDIYFAKTTHADLGTLNQNLAGVNAVIGAGDAAASAVS